MADDLEVPPQPSEPRPPRSIPFPPSSQIASITYLDDEMILYVEFLKNGATYAYSQVPSDIADGFSNAPSAGRYLNQFIKNLYDYEKIG
jgi:hypothetical protein